MTATKGPDFISPGMPKAATGWLFDQLSHHPDFWMPPFKELHYFDSDFPRPGLMEVISKYRRAPQQLAKRRGRKGARELTERDKVFFDDACTCKGKPADIETYRWLFRHKQDQLSGDITPSYCGLSDDEVERIANGLPETKILFMFRDPVARAWSRMTMRYRQQNVSAPSTPAGFGKLRAQLADADANVAGSQTQLLALWRRFVPETRIRYYLLDDITENPAAVRTEILEFLGAEPAKKSGDLSPGYNRKSKFAKMAMPPEVREMLIAHFADELRASAEMFGRRGGEWLKLYGLVC